MHYAIGDKVRVVNGFHGANGELGTITDLADDAGSRKRLGLILRRQGHRYWVTFNTVRVGIEGDEPYSGAFSDHDLMLVKGP